MENWGVWEEQIQQLVIYVVNVMIMNSFYKIKYVLNLLIVSMVFYYFLTQMLLVAVYKGIGGALIN